MQRRIDKICFLPKEGIANPFQVLMMEGLRERGFDVSYGLSKRFFSILFTWVSKKPDWIHLDWLYTFYSVNLPAPFKWMALYWFHFQLFFINRLTKCKIGYTLHNLERHEFYEPKIDDKAQTLAFKYADFIRVFNKRTIEKVSEKWKDVDVSKFYVQPEGSYVNYYPNEINASTAHTYFGYKPEDFVILCFGSIRPYKGVMELIDGFIKYRENNWKLLIAGYPFDKLYANEIVEKCKDNLDIKIVLGHQPEDELQYFFNACNVVVCPFKQIENSGSVILAMGFKKPVIAPNNGVVKYRLKEQSQLLFNESVSEVLIPIKNMEPCELEKIGQKNFEEVERYQWKDFAKLFNPK
jgi:glycosyltransferase involved in cell wall biosynthesis